MIRMVREIGATTVHFVNELGRLAVFAGAVVKATATPPIRARRQGTCALRPAP